jgi:two-component system response regulator FlrC
VAEKRAKKILWIDSDSGRSAPDLSVMLGSEIVVEGASCSDLANLVFEDTKLIVLGLGEAVAPLNKIKAILDEKEIQIPIVVRIPRHALELAVEVTARGTASVVAQDLLDNEAWIEIIKEHGLPDKSEAAKFVFVDPISRKLLALTERVAASNVTVLLAGPTGAGKEVLARILHDASPRFQGPFVAFNCAAMPESLIEDMLFGHDKGSFTGATKVQPGLFEQAQGGTIFLDEIGEMNFHLQAKLLRLLQERTVTRLGGQKSIDLDVRIVAASNKNLKAEIDNHTFREDLYFRLSAFKITIPPLRDRPDDIIPLAEQFASEQLGNGKRVSLGQNVKHSLLAHPWPGNVRELQNVMLRASVLTENTTIETQHLIFDDQNSFFTESFSLGVSSNDQLVDNKIRRGDLSGRYANEEHRKPLFQVKRDNEYEVILAALEGSESRAQAANKLGISPRTLRHKLQRLREQGLVVTRAYAR